MWYCVVTDLLGGSVGFLGRVGHQARRHGDPRLLQQVDAQVLVQRQVPLLLPRHQQGRLMAMVTKQPRRPANDLGQPRDTRK